MDVNMLLESIRESLHQIGVFLPRLLLAIIILIIGWVFAKAVRFAIVKALRAINFSVVTEKAGIDQFLKQGGADIDTVRVLGSLSYWLVILAALMVASNTLDLAYVTDLIGRIVLFVPKVIVAIVILAFGADEVPARHSCRRSKPHRSPRAVRDHGLRDHDRARSDGSGRHHPPGVPDHRRGHRARFGAGLRPGRSEARRGAHRALVTAGQWRGAGSAHSAEAGALTLTARSGNPARFAARRKQHAPNKTMKRATGLIQ